MEAGELAGAAPTGLLPPHGGPIVALGYFIQLPFTESATWMFSWQLPSGFIAPTKAEPLVGMGAAGAAAISPSSGSAAIAALTNVIHCPFGTSAFTPLP